MGEQTRSDREIWELTARINIFYMERAKTYGFYFTEPCQTNDPILNKIETSRGAALVLTHELVFICSYFSPMLPPFCFWNSMYRKVLEKNASVDGSATELSLCFSVLINSIKSWITVFVICGIPFSKKYKYLKMVKAQGLLWQKSIVHQKILNIVLECTCSKFQ